MKTVFLLLAGILAGSNGFADKKDLSHGAEATVGQNSEETSWPDRLQNSKWQERKKAVKSWRTALNRFKPSEILTHLTPKLFDKSRKVQETMPEVFTDLVESYPVLAPEIIEIVMEKVQDRRAERFSLIETAGKKGLSHSDYQIKLRTIDLLTETGIKYPSISSEIAFLFKARQGIEQTHRIKVTLKKALTALEQGVSAKGASSSCDGDLWRSAGRRSSGHKG